MALVSIVIIGIHLFSDIGIHAALIQNEREDADFVNTMWTMEVIRGFALWLIALAIAGPVGTFYGELILASLIPVAALTSSRVRAITSVWNAAPCAPSITSGAGSCSAPCSPS
jgi:hypothetical protein